MVTLQIEERRHREEEEQLRHEQESLKRQQEELQRSKEEGNAHGPFTIVTLNYRRQKKTRIRS